MICAVYGRDLLGKSCQHWIVGSSRNRVVHLAISSLQTKGKTPHHGKFPKTVKMLSIPLSTFKEKEDMEKIEAVLLRIPCFYRGEIRSVLDMQSSDEIAKISQLLTGNISELERVNALYYIREIAPNQRVDVLEKTVLFSNATPIRSDIATVLHAIAEIAPDQRSDVIEKASLLVKGIKRGTTLAAALKATISISFEQRKDVIGKIFLLFEDLEDESWKAIFFKMLAITPPEERTLEHMIRMIELFKSLERSLVRACMLELVQGIRVDQKTLELLQLLKAFFETMHDMDIRRSLFKVIADLPVAQRTSSHVKAVFAFFQGNEDASLVEEVLQVLIKVSSEEKQQIIECIFPLVCQSLLDSYERSCLFLSLMEFPRQHRTQELMETYMWFFRETKDQKEAFLFIHALKNVLSIENGLDPEEYKALFSSILRQKERLFLCRYFGSSINSLYVDRFNRIKSLFSRNFSGVFSIPLARFPLIDPSLMSAMQEMLQWDECRKTTMSGLILKALCFLGKCSLSDQEKELVLAICFPVEKFQKYRIVRDKLETVLLAVKMQARKSKKNPSTSESSKLLEMHLQEKALILQVKQERKELLHQMHENCSLITPILEFGFVKQLRGLRDASQFAAIVQNILEIEMDNASIEHFKEKYLATFASFRCPNAIFIYAGALKIEEESLEDVLLFQKLQMFIQEVLTGQFAFNRYAKSDHLQRIFQKHPLLEPKWKLGCTFSGQCIKEFSSYQIVDTDDPEDLLLCGTEVGGSCHSIHAVRAYNKFLLGFLLDGKNRLIAVKNKQGKIIARSIIRLLYDPNNQVPVVFQEKIYYEKGANAWLTKAIDLACLEKAIMVGVSLAAKESSLSSLGFYPGHLHSFSNRAGLEYSDAGKEGTNGTFVITEAQLFS